MSQRAKRFYWLALILIGSATHAALADSQASSSARQTGAKAAEPALREPDPAIMAELRAAKGQVSPPDQSSSDADALPFALDDLLGGGRDKPSVDGARLVQAATDAAFLSPELSFQRGREVFGKLTPPSWLVGAKLRQVGMPAALAVKGDALFVVDELTNMLLKLDVQAGTVWPFMDLTKEFSGNVGGIHVTSNGDLYLSDRLAGRVLRFTASGERQQVYRAPGNLKQPGKLYVNEENGHVMVLDESFSRILIFNKYAEPAYVLGSRGETKGHFIDPTSIHIAGKSVYVTDAIGLQVQRLNLFGEAEQVFGLDTLFNPSAVAVDAYGRVYVADMADDYIKIFQNGRLLWKYGGSGVDQGKFREIRALAIEGDRLYVAEAMNRRIQVFKISSP